MRERVMQKGVSPANPTCAAKSTTALCGNAPWDPSLFAELAAMTFSGAGSLPSPGVFPPKIR